MPLGDWPTPLEPIEFDGRTVWVKREGASSAVYGGNKVRTLEIWFGLARERGAHRLWAIGAYGSNHVVATALHAPADLEVGAILFPQPASVWAVDNCGALLARRVPIIRLRSVVEVPFVGAWVAARDRDALVMPPGGATAVGAFGAAAAAFELAEQIAAELAPAPARIVVAVGSTCTAAGLLAGLALARAVGAWPWPVPLVHGVRVTPWPVTSRWRIADYAYRVLTKARSLGGPAVKVGRRELAARLVIDGDELGAGYGHPTPRGTQAIAAWESVGGATRLDGVYSAKAAAALRRLHAARVGPLVFWASKSEAGVPAASLADLRGAAPPLVRWLGGRAGRR